MKKIGIYNESGEDVPYLTTLKKVIKKAMEMEEIDAELNIIIVDDDYIWKLNRDYRHIDRPTDVITFALEDDDICKLPEGKRVLGDVYISIDTAKRQAESYGHGLEREICFLAVHGFYHLLGYDHQTESDAKIMFAKQEEVLEKYGIKREK